MAPECGHKHQRTLSQNQTLYNVLQVINLPLVTIRIKQNTSRDTELMHQWRK